MGLHLDPGARRAWFSGTLLDLRPREYDLLQYLAQHPHQVLPRTTLLDRVWGEAAYIDPRTVDVHIHRLRRKLAQADPTSDPIHTERGIGYRWEP
jgi:DNA-binding response OmpR family regulator